jgi:hypothetical protein
MRSGQITLEHPRFPHNHTKMSSRKILLKNVMLCVVSLTALVPSNAVAGKLMGTVYCVDTKRPARLAVVHIERDATQGQASGVTSQVVVTGMDGSFESSDLEPGKYFITATFDGYVNETHAESITGFDTLPVPLVEGVEVELGPGESVRKQITLYRGAALSGVVEYDDGSPAVGVTVTADSAGQNPGELSGSSIHGHAKTDDRGRYRVSGLREGGYYVHTEPAPSLPVPIYCGDKITKHAAASIILARSEEYSGADIFVPLSNLHRVAGILVARGDQRSVNGLQLTLKSMDLPSLSASAISGPDGSFEFAAIPPGHYVIEAEGASIPVGVLDSDVSDVTLNLESK